VELETLQETLSQRLGDHVVATTLEWGTLTLTLDAEGFVEAARICREDTEIACDFFDWLSGVDEREGGFSVVASLYSTSQRHRVLIRHLCAGGRETPSAPTLTHLYRGADWHEREAWDMFGIEFDGHPGLEPRILCPENFEGWPLRKDFFLGTREAKPWPGLKEPLELDPETGQPLEREPAGPGAAPGPSSLDEAMAEQAKIANDVVEPEPEEIAEDVEADPQLPHTTAPGGEAVGATAEEAAAAKAERGRRKAAALRESATETEGGSAEAPSEETPSGKAPLEGAPSGEAGDAEAGAGAEPVEDPGEAARVSAMGDPRVSSTRDRQTEGDVPFTAQDAPGPTPEDEESRRERAERAAEESQARRTQPQPPEGQGGPPGAPPDPDGQHEQGTTPRADEQDEVGEPASKDAAAPGSDSPTPGAHAGPPPTTQEPGLAPVDGGLRETPEEVADAGPGPSGGERPADPETVAAADDEASGDRGGDRSRTVEEPPAGEHRDDERDEDERDEDGAS
jgi:NADH:ubiquinone oxidoreductase subunit C